MKTETKQDQWVRESAARYEVRRATLLEKFKGTEKHEAAHYVCQCAARLSQLEHHADGWSLLQSVLELLK